MASSSLYDTPLLVEATADVDQHVDGSVDYKGQPARLSSYGGWRSACFIIAVEVTERFAYFGISSNLITYLTGYLGQSTATAAENVNTWAGTATLLPLLGGVVADSFLGRYRTVIASSFIYILGLGLLTLSAALASLDASERGTSGSPSWFQEILFFSSLYLVAIGQAGLKPCLQAFGADQFDGQDPEGNKAKSSFFNWCFFCSSAGIIVALLVVVYIQENLNWVLGFGIPCTMMITALVVFQLGSRTYRYSVKGNRKNPFMQISQVMLRFVGNWRSPSAGIAAGEETYLCDQSSHDQEVCSVNDFEKLKALLRLIPICFTSLAFQLVFPQTTTFFTKQGVTMDRRLVLGFQIPAASLQTFIGFAIILSVPIYDRVFVPLARSLIGNPSGITMLQRIGIGMFLSAISMVTAALVEKKRLETAKEYGMVDLPNETLPMSIWWLTPQYALYGVAIVFAEVGLQEFFYDQVPEELRSVGLSLYHSASGVGSFLSSCLVSVITTATDKEGQDCWFSDNLNKGHLDYFYWILAGLNGVGFIAYLNFAGSYIYRTNIN